MIRDYLQGSFLNKEKEKNGNKGVKSGAVI